MSVPDILFERPEVAAPRVLGALLTCRGVTVRLTEVEAYAGDDDPGSHCFRGRTARNATMFGPPGHLYVYFTYGMHHCANLVCLPEGQGAGMLLRAGEIVAGVETARARRNGAPDLDLARGPARLCQALGLTRADDGTSDFSLELGPQAPVVATGPRVGLRLAAERPWRFWLPDEPSVSRYRPAKQR